MRALLTFLLLLAAPVLSAPYPPSRIELPTKSETSLAAAMARTDDCIARLDASIRISKDLVIPWGKTVAFGRHKFHLSGGATVRFDGVVRADRAQIFVGFPAGAIRGRFGGEAVKPEWWGIEPQHAERAINCAIQASTPWVHGVDVSLAGVQYEVSGPCDLRGTLSTLTGAGMNMTSLVATAQWDPKSYQRCTAWPGWENHTAMVWLGSKTPASIQSHGTGISGVHLNCQAAAFNAEGRISGVSWDWAEEGSFVKRCYVSKASGFGIGCAARTPESIAMCTHLVIDECWIMGATFRDYRPLHFTQHCMVAVRSTTIDPRFYKEESADYVPALQPAQILQPPQYGISGRGLISLDGVHIEACEHGIAVLQGSGPSQVAMRNVSFLHGITKGMTWYGDAREEPPAGASQTDYSSAVLICQDPGWGSPLLNAKDTVVIEGLRSANADRLVTDVTFNAIMPTAGYGQFPAERTGQLAFWARGTPYGSGPAAGSFWTPQNPLTDRPYTLGPVR